MNKLLMILGDRSLAEGRRGAFYNTLEELHKHWERIDVIIPKLRTGQLVRSIFGNVFLHPSPWPLIAQPFWILKKGRQIYEEQKFDLITVHEYPPFYNGMGARLLWNKIKTPYVLEIMHIPGHPRAVDLKERFYKWAARCFIKTDARKAAKIRVINQHQIPKFLVQAGVPADRILYIPASYIDLDIFRPIKTQKEYDLIFAARLEKNKGIILLLQAISKVKVKMPNVKLLIVGSGPLKAKLQGYVKGNCLEHNVFFSGWLKTLNDVARAYNSAKIFICPSFNEGGPRVAFEAMACGLPVITTKIGAMLDVINDGKNGLFTDWSSEEMAVKIGMLLNNRELQNKFSQEGLKLAERFEKKSAIKNYADKLKNFIGGRG